VFSFKLGAYEYRLSKFGPSLMINGFVASWTAQDCEEIARAPRTQTRYATSHTLPKAAVIPEVIPIKRHAFPPRYIVSCVCAAALKEAHCQMSHRVSVCACVPRASPRRPKHRRVVDARVRNAIERDLPEEFHHEIWQGNASFHARLRLQSLAGQLNVRSRGRVNTDTNSASTEVMLALIHFFHSLNGGDPDKRK
jgi:hypothetical protein